jgi:hypothetical protein
MARAACLPSTENTAEISAFELLEHRVDFPLYGSFLTDS